MDFNLAKVIKFPTKARRKYYQKKLFSLKSLVEIVIITIGVLIADLIVMLIERLL